MKSIATKAKPRLICLAGVVERNALEGCRIELLKKNCVLSMGRNAKATNRASVTDRRLTLSKTVFKSTVNNFTVGGKKVLTNGK